MRGVGLLAASAAMAACTRQPEAIGSASGSALDPTSAVPLLAIIYTNDTHGHDVEVNGGKNEEGNFSMAAVAALEEEWKSKGYDVILVDAGDATQGTPLVDMSNGRTAMGFMNACGYDLMTVGNHEFDWGPDVLKSNEEEASFPFLSANVLNKSDGQPRFTPNKTVELLNGTKVGFFGLTTPTTLTTASPKVVADFTFLQGEELYACAQNQVNELRKEGCELVVCVAHLGNDTTRAGQSSKDVLSNVQGIDLMIDGHDHKVVEEEVSGALLVEAGCYLHNVGVVVIDDGAPANDLVAYGNFDGIDATVQKIIDEENKRVEGELGVVLARTDFRLDGDRDPGVRTQETNLGDFCADAFRWTASQELGKEVDAGLTNGGSLRASLEAGDISLKDIKTVLPFGNDLSVVKVTGSQLLEALEAACQGLGTDTVLGAFPQVSGITFTVDTSIAYDAGPIYPDSTYASPAAPGSRVTITDVGGRGFDETESYSIATISFLCEGGDTYYAFKEAADIESPVTFGFDYESIVSYLVEANDHNVPDEYAAPQGRITIR